MSREEDFASLMEADDTLMDILLGGVHQTGEVGLEGISRATTPAAFDANGFLLPSALVKQRGKVPTGAIVDYNEQISSARQIVEVWLYEDRGYTNIDAAAARLYALLQGHMFSDSYEVRLANVIDRTRDEGALAGASLARLDWQVDSIIEPAGG